MTSLTTTSQLSARPARKLGLASLQARIVDVLSLLVAAVRVARAVEARRDPAAADLKTLGIAGPLPKTW